MPKRVCQDLSPQESEALKRKYKLLIGFLLALAILSLAGGLVHIWYASKLIDSISIAALSLFLSAIGILFITLYTRDHKFPGFLLILIFHLVLFLSSVAAGGLHPHVAHWHVLVPILAMFLLGGRWGIAWSGVVFAEYTCFVLLKISGIELEIQKGFEPMKWTLADYVFQLIFLLFVMYLVWLYETSRKKNLQSLQRSLEENYRLDLESKIAQASNTSKSEFIARMSHELRTPLNAIIGYAELLEEEFEDPEMQEYLDDVSRIGSSGKHLLQLINDMLDISKIEAGKMDLHLGQLDLPSFAKELEEIVEPLLIQHQNALHIQIDEEIDSFVTDETKLRQVLLNLLGNAAKFTEKGDISLSIHQECIAQKDWLSFQVRDTGIGLSKAQQKKLFEPFSQAEATTSKQYGGTGLGLVICKKISELLGGKILLESQLGKGATFTILLPKAPSLEH